MLKLVKYFFSTKIKIILNIIYGKTAKNCLPILDSAGQETPLLMKNKKEKSLEDIKIILVNLN